MNTADRSGAEFRQPRTTIEDLSTVGPELSLDDLRLVSGGMGVKLVINSSSGAGSCTTTSADGTTITYTSASCTMNNDTDMQAD